MNNERGKIIVIEGTDCSGKETQTRLLVEKLEAIGKKVKRISFPMTAHAMCFPVRRVLSPAPCV